MGDNELLVLAVVLVRSGTGQEAWKTGLVRLDLSRVQDFEVVRWVEDRPGRKVAWFGMSLLASNGAGRGWFLDPGRGELVEVDMRRERTEVRVLATKIVPRPEREPERGFGGALRAYESSAYTAGVFADDGRGLFVLDRAVTDEGVVWRLGAVGEDGKRGAATRLPTEATWLTLVPGRRRWAAIERGSVEGLGKHSPGIERAILIPVGMLPRPGATREVENDPQPRR